MPARTRTPRALWIEAGLDALAAGGPEAVRIEPLAQRLGVTKGGFYWHFDDRGALLDAMLDTWERLLVDRVVERVEGQAGDAVARLRHLFSLAASTGELFAVELAVRDWARRDTSVATRLRRVDDRRMAYMRSLFGAFCVDADDVEARCLLAMSLFVGSHFIAAEPGPRRREAFRLALDKLLAEPASDRLTSGP